MQCDFAIQRDYDSSGLGSTPDISDRISADGWSRCILGLAQD